MFSCSKIATGGGAKLQFVAFWTHKKSPLLGSLKDVETWLSSLCPQEFQPTPCPRRFWFRKPASLDSYIQYSLYSTL